VVCVIRMPALQTLEPPAVAVAPECVVLYRRRESVPDANRASGHRAGNRDDHDDPERHEV
jgi:hypothetical protein